MKKILVPTDFSKAAFNALLIASQIASRSEDTIVELLHVEEPFDSGHSAGGENLHQSIDDVFMLKILERVNRKIKKIAKHPKFKDITIKPIVKVGNVYKEIVAFIENEKPSLVIMGARGINDWDRFLVGSNTDKIVNSSTAPVLVVHKEDEEIDIKNIVFATNNEEDIDKSIGQLKTVQKLFNAKLHILRVITLSDFYTTGEAEKDLQSFALRYALENYEIHQYNANYVEEGIIQFSQDNNIDLISIITHKHSLFQRLFSHVSTEVINHSPKPVLAFNIG